MAVVIVVVLAGCTPAPTEEDHPYYLDWRDTKDALQRVIEAREDNLFIFPEQEPMGVNDIMSYASNDDLKQMFYVYRDVRILSCISRPPEKCSHPEEQEGASVLMLAEGTDGDKEWRLFAKGVTGGPVDTELSSGEPNLSDPVREPQDDEWGNMDSPPKKPVRSPSVDRVLALWSGYTLTTTEEPAWIEHYAEDPPVCLPDCY
ncbi:hypothetical protein ACFSYH_12915 [Populibacterium corticicola]|uniref:Lipoprotein n=1 Tax=Populibacterium corticicola TaxID=1812826 RepID=A0ABW5XG81_9MICO